jgi:hypothetical protein
MLETELIKCPHCSESFHKHTKLRDHVFELHRDALVRESRSSTPRRVVKKKSIRSTMTDDRIEEEDAEALEEVEMAAGAEIRFRPFKCEIEGCEWSFETAQRLRVHQRVHQRTFGIRQNYICTPFSSTSSPSLLSPFVLSFDRTAKRYICSHQSHTQDFPSFSKWSDLQNHIKNEHPPVCPYEICHVRINS